MSSRSWAEALKELNATEVAGKYHIGAGRVKYTGG